MGTLNGIGQTLPDPKLLLSPLQSREAITSSRIEGTYVTPEQLLLFELEPNEPISEAMADWQEVHNYGRCLERGCELLQQLPFCHRVIREMHEILMRGVRGSDKRPGEYRRLPVQIGHEARFVPPPHAEVDRLMDNLERYLNDDAGSLDPLVKCYVVHYQFEAIHPFCDGNGRIGRALLALTIYRWLDHSRPWLYLSPFFERYRDEYVNLLFKVSTRGDWSAWVEFCLRGTVEQANDSIERCRRLNALRQKYHARGVRGPRTHAIIEGLFTSPILSITTLAARLDISYATAKSDVQRLVDAGILTPLATGRPAAFYAPEIMRVAYASREELLATDPA